MYRDFWGNLKCFVVDTARYGPSVSISRYKYDISKASGNPNIPALKKMHRAILAYLDKKYHFLIEKYNNIPISSNTFPNKHFTIWCFWWQGIKDSPSMVKVCIESIIKANPNCNVIILDKYNYSKYVDIPDFIVSKVKSGAISYTHFSDILRFNLLEKHGGVWMDSTILCINPLQQEYFYSPFFTAKSKEQVSECVANYRWTCYLMSGEPQNIVFNYMSEFYYYYFQNHDSVLHYFLTDYALELAYENIPYIRSILDSIPINNENRSLLTKHLCDEYSSQYSLENLKKGNTAFFKLFWKQKYVDYSESGAPTVWNYLKNSIAQSNF